METLPETDNYRCKYWTVVQKGGMLGIIKETFWKWWTPVRGIKMYKVIDLFAGAGGLSLGFMQTGKYDIQVIHSFTLRD